MNLWAGCLISRGMYFGDTYTYVLVNKNTSMNDFDPKTQNLLEKNAESESFANMITFDSSD